MLTQEIILRTIQGEGYNAGKPCDFIRLKGCPVGCQWCDQKYEAPRNGRHLPSQMLSIPELIDATKSGFVVISGGEPFVHKQLPKLVNSLIDDGRSVAIETSGSFWQQVHQDAWITLSPKEHINSKYPTQSQFWGRANEIKLVITNGDEIDYYRSHLEQTTAPLFLQPEWYSKRKSLDLCFDLLRRDAIGKKAKLSVQIHKFLGVN